MAQLPGRREKTSLKRRSPADNPAFASSPTISAAEATSSAPPGGWTGPSVRSLSHSKPCRGAGSSETNGRGGGVGRFAARARPARTVLDGRRLDPLAAFASVEAAELVTAAGPLVDGLRAAAFSASVVGPRLVAGAFVRVCLRAGFAAPFAPLVPPGVRPFDEPAPRAAARRALERCGRVRGRLASTLPCSRALSGLGPLASASVIRTSLLKPAGRTSWRP